MSQDNLEENFAKKLHRVNEEAAILRQKLENHQKTSRRFERYRVLLIVAAAPTLLIFFPAIFAYAVFRYIRKRNQKAKISKAGAVTTHVEDLPTELNISEDNPNEVIGFLSRLNKPLRPPKDKSETVSVVIPSYNNAGYLELAIKSAIFQLGVTVEVIVVDDCSSDNSLSVATQLAKIHPNLKVISLARNFGCYYARNIALLHATGDYIALVDSDDIMHPERLFRQLALIKRDPKAVASRCLGSRWSPDFKTRLQNPKGIENTLLFKRGLIDEFGYYDTVRFAGDSEFRERIMAVHLSDSIPLLEQELYYLRATPNSLTEISQTYAKRKGKLKTELSFDRFAYQTEYKYWHLKCVSEGRPPRMRFPQTHRPFDLDTPSQNASPSLGEEVIGGMATFPARAGTLEKTLPSILNQVDRLHIYLNGFKEVPDFLSDPKIHVVLGKNAEGDLRDNGKFYRLVNEKGYIFTFDDDIHYPSDYVATMVSHIENYDRRAVVGVHGVTFPEHKTDYLSERTVSVFHRAAGGKLVDLLGTGTTAFHSTYVNFAMSDFKTKGVCDLWFAVIAAEQKVPLVNIPRNQDWLVEAEIPNSTTRLFDEAKRDVSEHTRNYHNYLFPLIKDGKARQAAWEYLAEHFPEHSLRANGITPPSRRP